jgi:peptidoglycan/LPS O-acetylase OafA/YrhL
VKAILETPADDSTLPARPPEDTPGGMDLNFRPDVEGLRAVAVVLVVLFHAGVSWLPGGYVGVDVFFVISGFLITGLLLREYEKRGRISISGFYARRARRILPAAMLVIVLAVIASYFIQNFIEYGNVSQDGRWATLFAGNFHFAAVGNGYFQKSVAPSPLQHFWTLAVEEQFYLVWPPLVLLVSVMFRRIPFRWRVTTIAGCAIAASMIWSIIQTNNAPVAAYFSPFTRAWELGLGAITATLVPQLSRVPKALGSVLAYAGLAAVVASAAWYTSTTPFPGTAALLPVLGTVAIVAGGASGGGAKHLLGLRPMRSVGRVSFGWYLLHYPPMIILTGALWVHPLSVQEDLLIAAATLVAAYIMYAIIERPIRRSSFLAHRPWLSIAMGATMVLTAFLVCDLLHPSLHTLLRF